MDPTCGFDKICKSWNVAFMILFPLYLPYNTHTWILGQLPGQGHNYKK